jgi:hypothetical protein
VIHKREIDMDDGGPTLLARYPVISRHLFAVDDYHRIGDAGILTEDDRVELIEGELVEMVPMGSEHAGSVVRSTTCWSWRLACVV